MRILSLQQLHNATDVKDHSVVKDIQGLGRFLVRKSSSLNLNPTNPGSLE